MFSGEDYLRTRSDCDIIDSTSDTDCSSLTDINFRCKCKQTSRCRQQAKPTPRPWTKLRKIGIFLKRVLQLISFLFLLLLIYDVLECGCLFNTETFLEDLWFEVELAVGRFFSNVERKILEKICETGLLFSPHFQGIFSNMEMCILAAVDCCIALLKLICVCVQQLMSFIIPGA